MRPVVLPAALFAAAGCALLLGCAEGDPARSRLEIDAASPLSLKVGDTSRPFTVTKFAVDARGREEVLRDYAYFTLVSGDDTIAKVVPGRRVLGVAPGSTTILADDDRSNLLSENKVTVEVVP